MNECSLDLIIYWGQLDHLPFRLPKNDENGAIMCILSVPKLVVINLKIDIFWIINNPSFVPYFSPRSIQMITLTQKGGLGAIAPRSQRNVKK